MFLLRRNKHILAQKVFWEKEADEVWEVQSAAQVTTPDTNNFILNFYLESLHGPFLNFCCPMMN